MAQAHAIAQSQHPHRKFKLSIRFVQFKTTVVQIVFWLLSYFILLALFAGSEEWQTIDHIYTLVFMSTLMMAVGLNSWFLISRYLRKGKYIVYLVMMLLDIVVFTYFNFILFDKLIDFVLPGYYFISYYEITDLLKFFGSFILITTLIQLAMEWFQLQETREAVILLEKEKINAELQALTNQVNPHFLFNSLSVLYSLALRESKDAPNAIMQLSDILRYVIYDSTRKMVTLEAELSLIKNYIGLQRYRVHPSTKIDFNADVNDPNVLVMPMTFLPLIENSFKHGVHAETENAFIEITLRLVDSHVQFTIRNSKPENSIKSTQGIGLKNIESRLKLVYPEGSTFKIEETNDTFHVLLKLPVRQ
jgi:sensor histidine kinase YesM